MAIYFSLGTDNESIHIMIVSLSALRGSSVPEFPELCGICFIYQTMTQGMG